VQSNAARFGLLAVLVAAAVVLFIVLSGGDDEGDDGAETTAQTQTTTAPEAPDVEVIELKNGAPVGGVRELTYAKGDRIRIEVRLDEPQEDVHIHGYDQEVLSPTGSAKFDFPANLDGIFELEAHGPTGDVALAEIVVNPA
jgi:hypothetical protein